MAVLDHSLTYRDRSLKNVGHRARLRDQLEIVSSLSLPSGVSYADFGCSNGYITERVAQLLETDEVTGFDHNEDNLDIGRQLRPSIDFKIINLNEYTQPGTWDFCTCFETLEHVGNIETAIKTVVGAARKMAFISVPIEIGIYGQIKFLAKMAYGYDVSELPGQTRLSYAKSLFSGRRMSALRDPSRLGWSTHFGFDYRDVDDILRADYPGAKIWNKNGNRFYLIEK